MPEYILGIDTGGTYTDGVLIQRSTQEIHKSTKTLTTKPDLTEGILGALNDLLPDDPSQIKLVVISTTLATNAIAEGKGRPVGLSILGIFHSCPDHPNQPSAFDQENTIHWYSYLITSVQGGQAVDSKCWWLRDNRAKFNPEEIILTDQTQP